MENLCHYASTGAEKLIEISISQNKKDPNNVEWKPNRCDEKVILPLWLLGLFLQVDWDETEVRPLWNDWNFDVSNLGFILDSNLTMKHHAIKACQTAYYERKRISSICSYLTEEKLVTSCVLSRLDYCNSLLMGTPNSVIQPMQKFQNAAAGSYSQSNTPSTMRIPPTATSLASDFWTHQIQNCPCVLQLNHWFRPLLPFWTTAAVQPFPHSPLFIRHTHTQTLMLQPQNSWLSLFLLFRSSYLKQPLSRCQTL